jgi:hypothetical protein
VLDWRPFEYYTYELPMPGGLSVIVTTRFIPTETGTRVLGLCSEPQGSIIARNVAKLARSRAQSDSQKGVDALREVIIKELGSGAAVRPEASSVPPDQVAAAAQASVAEAGAD